MLHVLALWVVLVTGCLSWAATAWAQLPITGHFTTDALEKGWKIDGTGFLTAGRYDPPDAGWLWLADATNRNTSRVLNDTAFSAANGLIVEFEFTMWGGGPIGGDGIVVFLFDATQTMDAAQSASGLGYCRGAGGWLGIGLDAIGHFGRDSDACLGGPGVAPQSLTIRGPASENNPFIASAKLGDILGHHLDKQRPDSHRVRLHLTPKTTGNGYRIDVSVTNQTTQETIHPISNIDYPYAAPSLLRVGIAASTSIGKNVHELRNFSVRALPQPSPIAITPVLHPSTTDPAQASTLIFTVTNREKKSFTLTDDLRMVIDRPLTISQPVTLSGTCLGTVVTDLANSTLVLEKGHAIRPGSCTVGVVVEPHKSSALGR